MSHSIWAYFIDERPFAGLQRRARDPSTVAAELAAIEARHPDEFEDFGDDWRLAVRTFLGDPAGAIDTLAENALEQPFKFVCEHCALNPAGAFTRAPNTFYSDVTGMLRGAGADASLTYARLLKTPCFEPGDYVVTLHTAEQVREIVALLAKLDLKNAGDFETVAKYFGVAAGAGRGLAVFVH